jgi:SOS regulatory protein LexA
MSVVLGENIKAARKEAGLRQEDLAELVSITQGGLSQIEKGRTPPSSETFQALRKELVKKIGESRVSHYLPKHLAEPSEVLTHRLIERTGGAEINVLGRVAAGKPIQPFEMNEALTIPSQMVARGKETFALQVQGDSMNGFGILHGDIIILHRTSEPANGQIVVARIGMYEYTLKTWERKGKQIILKPANQDFDEIILTLGKDEVECVGEFTGLIRFAK